MGTPRSRRPWPGMKALLFSAGAGMLTVCGCAAPDHSASTARLLRHVAFGLERFYRDWGVYPPSSKDDGGPKEFGYQNLAHCLLGPQGRGWGAQAGGAMPFGDLSSTNENWGPYFNPACESLNWAADTPDAILDTFKPGLPILYFRRRADAENAFRAADNPIDPGGQAGFAGQEHFEMFARRLGPDGAVRWVAAPYILISAGRDRLYGHVAKDKTTGQWRLARPDEQDDARCDDVTNVPQGD